MGRRLPDLTDTELIQHVVMLGPGTIEHQLHDGQLDYRFTVHYLRDEPVAPLLADTGLAPFAPLADLPDDARRAQALRTALDLIAQVNDERTRTVLAQAATDLAAIRLDEDTIDSTWEDSAMPFPSLLQRKYDEGRVEGRVEGREGVFATILCERFGPDARIPAIARRLASLPDDRVAHVIITAADLDELAGADD